MNIKFILLSLCLTVKVPNIKSLFIPPVAIAKTAKGYVNAIGILGTYTAVSDQIEDKAGQVLDYIDEFQVFAKDLAYGLNDQVY